MRFFWILTLFFLFDGLIIAQEYQFTPVINVESTPVVNQGRTGTCWSFSTTSFLESEIIRISGKHIDLSEMYNVRYTYPAKAYNYVMRQGSARFGEGALAHDVINSVKAHGLVPYEVYPALEPGQTGYDHAEMVAVLTSMVKTYADNPGKKLSDKWEDAFDAVLDVYMGKPATQFTYEGKSYTPASFMTMTGIHPEDYVTLASLTNHPYYSSFIMSIPDNFSNGSYYNVHLNELTDAIDNALKMGYTIALDIDVSEPTFSGRQGVAVVPADAANNKLAMTEIVPEKQVTPENRQAEFLDMSTTDDHLMQIVGTMKDQKGNIYYKVKNSWGTAGLGNGGFVYISQPYIKLKTISILLHKDGLSKEMRNNLGIK